MNFSIARLQTIPEVAWERLPDAQPQIFDLPFPEQYRLILASFITHGGGFAREMECLGNRSIEILTNCRPLQAKWAEEHGFRIDPTDSDWQSKITLAQLRDFKPEIVYLQDIFCLPATIRKRLKELIPSIRMVIIQKGFPGETRPLEGADMLVVSSPILMDRYRHLKPHLVYHSFDQDILRHVNWVQPTDSQDLGLIFTGSVRVPELRYWVIRNLLSDGSLSAWVPRESTRHAKLGGVLNKRFLKKQVRRVIEGLGITHSKFDEIIPPYINPRVADELADLDRSDIRLIGQQRFGQIPSRPLNDEFPERVHEPVFGLDYFHLISRAKILFNLHADSAGFTVDNMKMFEATGMGTCLLTDSGHNLTDLFEPDHEIVTYSSMSELQSKIKYLNDHGQVRLNIARAGQKRTLREHTIKDRCGQLVDLIKSVR